MKLSEKAINEKLNELKLIGPKYSFMYSVHQGRNTIMTLTGHIDKYLNYDRSGLYVIEMTFKAGKWNNELIKFSHGLTVEEYDRIEKAKRYDRMCAS